MEKELSGKTNLKIKIKKTPLDREKIISKKIKFWEKVAKISIFLFVFLAPLFFLPWTLNPLDFNKQILLLFLVFVALLSWILKVLFSGEFEINLSFLSVPILIFLLVYGVATIFSVSTYGSFWGWPLNVSAGFLTLLYFFFLYFLITNLFSKKREVFWLLFALVLSGFLTAIFASLQLFGKFVFPWGFTQNISFNTIGTTNALSIFLATLLPLIIALVLMTGKLVRWFLVVAGLLILANLVLINFGTAWIVLIGETAILFIFGILNLKRGGNQLVLLSMAILAIALFSIILRFSLPGFPHIPPEILPSQQAEINIAKNSLLRSPVFGTGPGTFGYNYSQFKAKELNQTPFWNIRFGTGASEVLDKLITTGILGILSLLFIFGAFFWIGFKYLKEQITITEDDSSWFLGLGIFSCFTGTVLSQFLYPANFSLMLIFWIILASFVALEGKKVKSWAIQPSSKVSVGASLVLVLVLIFGFGFLLIGVQKYFAEVKYFSGLKALEKNNSDLAIQRLGEAVNLNSNLDIYWRDASQLYLTKLNEVLSQRDLSPEARNAQAQDLISLAVNSAKRATDLNPESVANWTISGFTYANTIGLLTGAGDWALNSYQRATELEPTNPYIFTEIGRVYLSKSDLAAQQKNETETKAALKLASENFEKALSLKSDYAPAHFQIAMIYVREGKIKEAVDKLETLKQTAPSDVGLAFQLGVIYYNDNQFGKAKGELERAVRLDENYSNARYFLGLAYDKEGNKQEAILQFEEIEKSNPGNEEIKKILSNLRAGKSALEGVLPVQPPIEEKPPERLEK